MENRFILQHSSTRPNGWVLTDIENGIVLQFEEHHFNTTQKLTYLNDIKPSEMLDMPHIVTEMTDWMVKEHYFIAMPIEQDHRVMLGKKITMMREAKGMTMYQLAKEAEISPSTLMRIEQGRFSVKIDTLQKIATALGKKIAFV